MYRTLNPDKIITTLGQLEARILARFPNAGLGKVCGELCEIAKTSAARAAAIERPAYGLRIMTTILIGLAVGLLVYAVATLVQGRQVSDDLFSSIQAVEASLNLVLLIAAALYFVVKLEERNKRNHALLALSELRSICHVIDMHQLTKDPMIIDGPRTSASPERNMTPFELTRYLDYCSEMLSLTAKIAVLYAQASKDATVIDAVSDLSALTTNLSTEIWQKITMVQAHALSADPTQQAH
jgi:hypothetical protein